VELSANDPTGHLLIQYLEILSAYDPWVGGQFVTQSFVKLSAKYPSEQFFGNSHTLETGAPYVNPGQIGTQSCVELSA
jgi:hypothetical protein